MFCVDLRYRFRKQRDKTSILSLRQKSLGTQMVLREINTVFASLRKEA
jgi:hypothetical protein